jgi:3-isopropylmalate/(R)-2-methylmalate dehydratase large subunit
MTMDDRITLCNHSAELGVKAALLEADQKTIDWLQDHGARVPKPVAADPDAEYAQIVNFEVGSLTPLVARSPNIDDVVAVEAVVNQPVQVALVGTCTNGRLNDIRQTAAILKGRKVSKGVRLLVTPASREVYLAADKEGLLQEIMQAGGTVASPGCGPCISVSQKYVPGDGDVVISSANRNFKGRLGNPQAEIWIASAATVAASAVTGRLTDPREVEGGRWRPV